MSAGHYQMHRGWMDNAVFRSKFCRAAAWVWLIESAAWKPRKFDIKGKNVTLGRGQLVASIRYMAEAWGWNRGAVDRYLTRLKTETMIETATVTGETVITICNYDIYQNGADETVTANVTANVTGAGQERDSTVTGAGQNKEGKESKEGKEGNLRDGRTADEFEVWWAEVPRKVSKGQARKAYRTARKIIGADVLISGIRRYAAEVKVRGSPEYTKHPATWLNGECWNDDPMEAGNGKSGNSEDRTAERRREMLKGIEDAGGMDPGLRSAERHNP